MNSPSATDAAVLLEAIAGYDARDRGSLAADEFRFAPKSNLHGLRIGFVRHFHETDLRADPEVMPLLSRWPGSWPIRVRQSAPAFFRHSTSSPASAE
jgi:aspartyl-tRNA(Asn)/glutamyl-tRNA(Gln) amidotransferase subunit A